MARRKPPQPEPACKNPKKISADDQADRLERHHHHGARHDAPDAGDDGRDHHGLEAALLDPAAPDGIAHDDEGGRESEERDGGESRRVRTLLEQPEAAATFSWYRDLLAVRRRHITPLLSSLVGGGEFQLFGASALQVRWRTTDDRQLMLMANLGRDFVVWDKAATIRYRKPGKGTVRAEFRLSDSQIEDVREKLKTLPKYEPVFTVEVKDEGSVKPGNLREHIRLEGVTIDLPVSA